MFFVIADFSKMGYKKATFNFNFYKMFLSVFFYNFAFIKCFLCKPIFIEWIVGFLINDSYSKGNFSL